jgi:glutamate-1-semialdehyde 2,1-aminomutase
MMFDRGYHGSLPPLLPGEPTVVTVPFNDLPAVDAALTTDIAAVFAEPFLGAGGVIPAHPGFLAAVQELALSRGALFVLDEVQSLRNAVGGEQERLGLRPDLTLLGKIIGGGFPIGAVGGRADLLALTASATPGALVHSGTFNGHLAAMAAGAVTLRDLDHAAIGRLDDDAGRLADRITSSGLRAGLPVTVTRAGSILGVHLDRASELHLALLLAGVYTTPRGMINLSTALTAADIDRVATAYAAAFERLAG